MLLVVDAGNTNVVFAVHDRERWRGIWRIATEPQRTSDEYAVWLLTLLNLVGLKPADIHRAVIGTVVPAALYHLRRLCREYFETEPLVARSELDWGFDIRVDNPAEVGADRLLNSLAAHRAYGGPLMVDRFRHRDHLRRRRRRRRLSRRRRSRPGSTSRSRRCTQPQPGCRASASAGRKP